MKVIHGLASLRRAPTPIVLTIGNFDGLHVGHRALISQVLNEAQQKGAISTVMSFDPHPTRVLRPDTPTPRLFSSEDLVEQLERLGVQQFVLEPFTKDLAQMSALHFVEYLLAHLTLQKLCIGHDFHFGHDREGTGSKLKEWAEHFNFELNEVAPFKLDGDTVSSSRIRKLITSGDVEGAARLLTRPYYVQGEIVPGDGRGHKIGFATANLQNESEIVPAVGVYVTRFRVGDKNMNAISNVGFKPTFHAQGPLSIETHVLDQNEQYVGDRVRVEFLKALRPEKKFAGVEQLVEQIRHDVAEARKYFAGDGG